MPHVYTLEENYENIADAIRTKLGVQTTYKPGEMAAAIETIGGGGGKNIQVYSGYDTVRTTSYSETDVTLTVAKTGTYNISWIGWRSTSSGTSGSQLYKNGTAVDTAVTTFTHTYGQYVHLTNQSLNAGDVLVVRARARGTSYYMDVGNLIIQEQ